MADPSRLPREQLERGRDLGGAMFCSSYIHLMIRELGLPEDDKEAINAMAMKMVMPINVATEAIWRALMEDDVGMRDALSRFEGTLGKL